jgi:hypothetical protein
VIESPLLKELQEAAEARGVIKGRIESIIDTLEDRFGTVPETIRTCLQSIQTQTRGEALFRIARHCPDLESFEAELGKAE